MSNTYSAGVATAYGAAVRGGYTGTYAEWCAAMADFGDKSQQAIVAAEQAAQSAAEAAGSATDAADSASSAETFKGNAEDSAAAAHNSETNAAASESAAAQSATGAADSASAAVGSATNAAASAAAAQAVKDSIPADYTALSEDVDELRNAVIDINGTILTLDYDKDIVYGSGYYVNNGQLAIASYANKRIRVNRGIRLKAGDIIEIRQSVYANLYIVVTEDEGTTYLSDSRSQPTIVPNDGVYYLTFYFTDNRTISDETARQLLTYYSFLRGTGNAAVINGENWAVDVSETGNVNFFDRNHLMNYRINTNTNVVTADYGHRMAWVKLPPNRVYNLHMTKVANTSVEFGLLNREPANGDVAIEVKSNYSNAEFANTFATTDDYCYCLIKYCLGSAGGEKADEILDSIEIKIATSIADDRIAKNVNNARHVKGNLDKAVTLAHFSDLHGDINALRRIGAWIDKYGSNIDDAICTGDITGDTYAEIKTWWDKNIMTCVGNHDTASYTSGIYDWTALSMADRDAYYIAPFESNWGITHTPGTSYYYKDYTTQKLRLIVMDVMLYNDNGAEATAQTDWLTTLMDNAITNGYHVVIAIHAPHGGASAKDCSFSRYNQGTMPTNSNCNTPQTVIDTVAAKISAGLKFVGYLVGHTHQDNIWNAENDGSQLMYCVTCAAVDNAAQWKNSDQYRDQWSDAINLVTIDTDNTLVKIVRCGGADIDDHMRTRQAICFNYATGQMVGEVL